MEKINSASVKIAFTGTCCSGKTTTALDTTARLKRLGLNAEVVSSQDRKTTWDSRHFPEDYRAHYGTISNLVHSEVQDELRGDVDVLITDRSVLDLYAVALYDHPANPAILSLESMVLSWCSSYTSIYYLEPLPYQGDNKRPPDSFRMGTHNVLMELISKHKLDNITVKPREGIFSDIVLTLNASKLL